MKKLTDKEKEKIVNEVIKGFDFQMVHRVMVLLDWKWINEVPSVEMLINQAEKLLYGVFDNENCVSMGTGGLVAGYTDADDGLLYLQFHLEESIVPLHDNDESIQ